jgi:hypothetical protein
MQANPSGQSRRRAAFSREILPQDETCNAAGWDMTCIFGEYYRAGSDAMSRAVLRVPKWKERRWGKRLGTSGCERVACSYCGRGIYVDGRFRVTPVREELSIEMDFLIQKFTNLLRFSPESRLKGLDNMWKGVYKL